jgi:hypothetical protein
VHPAETLLILSFRMFVDPGKATALLIAGGMLLRTPLCAVGITVGDTGQGNEYMAGCPIILPAASVSTNLFTSGVQVISNRMHCAKAAQFDESGRLAFEGAGTAGAFPPYLVGQPYVWFLQNTRHYTNYSCTVTVDAPVTFYLLVDNRVNDYGPESAFNDPTFGPPDTLWIAQDGWQRVNTGLTRVITSTNAGDYVGIDEGCNGTVNQVYAVYQRRLAHPGAITLQTEFDGNIYCLVIATNGNASVTGLQPLRSPPADSPPAHSR